MKRIIVGAAIVAVLIAGTGWFRVAGTAGDEARKSAGQAKVRKAAIAGLFYPSEREALERKVSDTLGRTAPKGIAEPVKAILAPHAGYIYCGESMGAVYKHIEGDSFRYDTVVMIGPSHHVPTKAAAVSSAEFWETPLGRIPVDTELARKFVDKSDRIEFDDRAHEREHSLEVQLPYLIAVATGKAFKVVPLVTSSTDPQDSEIVAQALVDLASRPNTLIVVSSDLSHFPDAKTAEKVDGAILRAVASLNPQTLVDQNKKLLQERHLGLSVTMCGLQATMCLEHAAKRLGIDRARVVSYTNSAKTSGDAGRVVGYGAVIFTASGKVETAMQQPPATFVVSDRGKKELIDRARGAVKAAVEGKWRERSNCDTDELQVMAGCFVTLKNRGKLRGCMGCFQSEQPLWKTVADMAAQSAVLDPRFIASRIRPEEIPHLEIEISILSPLFRVSQPLQEIKLGRDGIVIRDKGRSGTFLPQVAIDTGWSLEEFLGHCSRDKAGLGWDGWKTATAEIFRYTCIIVKDEDLPKAQ